MELFSNIVIWYDCINKSYKGAFRMNDHDMELLKIAVLYDMASQQTKDAAQSILANFESLSEAPAGVCHNAMQNLGPRPIS